MGEEDGISPCSWWGVVPGFYPPQAVMGLGLLLSRGKGWRCSQALSGKELLEKGALPESHSPGDSSELSWARFWASTRREKIRNVQECAGFKTPLKRCWV